VLNASDLKAITQGNETFKYADDTYIIIPSRNADSRTIELDNIAVWSKANNLKLNRSKCTEIIFSDNKRKKMFEPPSLISGLTRVTSMKILGVTFTNHLSMSDHVNQIVGKCAQTLYAMRILRAQGMCDAALSTVYQSVIVARIMHAACAWWGFTTAADRCRIDGFFRRGVRSGMCSRDMVNSFEELCKLRDKQLFNKVILNPSHVLHRLLPPKSVASSNYNLRTRPHDRQISRRQAHITDCNFINRMLFCDSY